MGIILQRALLLMAAASAPLLALYLQAEPVLRLIRQAPEIVPAAARYIRLFSPQILLHGLALCIFRWLVAQGVQQQLDFSGSLPASCHCIICCCVDKVAMTLYLVLYRSAGAVALVLAAAAVLCAATLPLNWLMVWTLDWGLDGSALAAVACELIYLAGLLAAAARHNACQPWDARPWQGLSCDALRGWRQHLKIAATGTIMLVLDWWQVGAGSTM